MKTNINRFMIAGTGSGCGKTTVTCALLQALKNRGMKVSSFKCGPDYIDPMFHSKVIGTKSANLDLFLCGEKSVKYIFAENSAENDISVIEGVMGNYDGIGADSDLYSTNHVARVTNTPQILVVGTKGVSFSLAAVIKGYLTLRENNIKGVILNNTSEKMYNMLKPVIEKELPVKVYGYLPKIKEATLESRHLGLVTADEIVDIKEKLNILAETAEKTLDIDGIIKLAQEYSDYEYEDIFKELYAEPKKTRIAIAEDSAFCFTYKDNIKFLEKMGAEILPFSPMHDPKMPENINMVIFPGGYPELYLKELSENKKLMVEIREKLERGLPVIAECGGFMYLHDEICDKEGNSYPMVGFVKGKSFMTGKLVRFGYTYMKAERESLVCPMGEEIRAHEFHYSDSDNCGDNFTARKSNGNEFKAVIGGENGYMGYPHLHLWGSLENTKRLYEKICQKTY